ncbi:MAG: glycosyltransferase family 4 protein [Bacteroidales bacterium]
MDKEHIIFFVDSSLSKRYGLFYAAHNRIREIHRMGISVSVYSVRSYSSPILNGIRMLFGKRRKEKGDECFIYDSIEYKYIWYKQGVIGYVLEKLGYPEYTIKQSLNTVVANDASLVMSHWGLEPGLWGLLYSRLKSIPCVTTYHGSDINYTPRCWRRVLKMVLSESDHNFFVSESLLNRAVVMFETINNPFVSYNGVNSVIKHNKEVKSQELTIGFAGSLTTVKGADRLAPIVSEILKNGLKIRLIIAGEGPLLKEILYKIESDRLPINVEGKLDTSMMGSFYDSIDLLIIPSRNEGLPMVMLEALAHKLAVVACNVGGISEFLPSRNLILVGNREETEIIDSFARCCKEVLLSKEITDAKKEINNWEEVVKKELKKISFNV